MKGSVLGIGDSKHPVLSLQHEALDRTTKIVDAASMKGSVLGIGDSKHPVLSLQHEALDRTTKIVDAAGTTKYSYYAGGLLKTEDGPWANDTMSYSYNNARLRSGLVL